MSLLIILSICLVVIGNAQAQVDESLKKLDKEMKPVEEHLATFDGHGLSLTMTLTNPNVEKVLIDSVIDIIVDGQSKEQIHAMKAKKELLVEKLNETFNCKNILQTVQEELDNGQRWELETILYSRSMKFYGIMSFCDHTTTQEFHDKIYKEIKKRYSKLNNLFNKE